MGKRLEQALAEADEIEAAEADQTDRPTPPHVKVSRPGRARSKVLQVRLNPEEFEAIEQIAKRRGLPSSTVAREQLLKLIAESEFEPSDLAGMASQLEAVTLRVTQRLRAMEPTGPGGRA